MDLNIDLRRGEVDMGAARHIGMDNLHYLKLIAESKLHLYDGSELSRLIGTLMLLNTCATHRVTNGLVDEFFFSVV